MLMKLITLNCNGIRSAFKKGLKEFIEKENPDLLAFQEIKATESEIDLDFFAALGYTGFINSAAKKGYSGVAIFSKKKPISSELGIENSFFDLEGRTIILEYKNFAFINTYFPSGTSGEERQTLKMQFLDLYSKKKKYWEKKYKKIIICGDVNIAHTEKDIHNPKGNVKNSGFLPEEREWLSRFLQSGLVDAYRFKNEEAQDYSWWTYRSNCRAQNKGWRIDYFFVTSGLEKRIQSCKMDLALEVSDHTAVILEIDLKF